MFIMNIELDSKKQINRFLFRNSMFQNEVNSHIQLTQVMLTHFVMAIVESTVTPTPYAFY